MKWLNKFSDGGRMAQQESQLRKVIASLTSLVKRAHNKDEEAKAQITAILADEQAAPMLDMVRQMAPELVQEMESLVQTPMAQNGGVVEYLQSLKCGGKMKKKTKKAEEGAELNEKKPYLKTKRLAKGGKGMCPCSLKRIGGTIVEVDCEGNVVSYKFGKGGRIPKHGLGDVLKRIWNTYTQNLTDPYDNSYSNNSSTQNIQEKKARKFDSMFDPTIKKQGLWVIDSDGTISTQAAEEAKALKGTYNPNLVIPISTAPEMNLRTLYDNSVQKIQDQDAKAIQERQQAAQSDKAAQAAQAQRVRTFYSKMSDSDKRALQDMLKSAGYYKGEIDGLIGNGTLSALRKFQQDNKLTVDGMAGRNTFDALRAKTRQVAQPTTDPTAVPGYSQAMQLLNQMNGSVSATPVKTGGPTGGMGLNDVYQGRDVQLVGPKVGVNLTSGLEIPQRKQGGWLNKKF